MGERLLRAHVQDLRQRLPQQAAVQRLQVEDNVVEFKVVSSDRQGGVKCRRLNFLVYEADAYPNSGGAMMSEDEDDEALMDTINARLEDCKALRVAEVIGAACAVLGVQDADLLACLGSAGPEAAAPACSPAASSSALAEEGRSARADSEALAFEGEDEDDDDGASYAMYVSSVAAREERPGWKKMRWQEVECERLARRKEQQRFSELEMGPKRRKGCGEMTLEEQKAADEQMWSSQEAFTILSNELFALETEADSTVAVDAVDYDVYQWKVRLSGCSGPLGADLRELKSRFGYDYIELDLSFKEDLHPFYPPKASVVRPRLQGEHDVLAALACHPRLQLRGWSPFQTSKDLLLSIRRFFESIARVDVSTEQNDPEAFPEGAFSPLECQLAHLGSLCELVPLDLRLDQPANPYKADPWAQDEALSQSSLGAMLDDRRRREQAASTGAQQQNFWAAGTGYGTDVSLLHRLQTDGGIRSSSSWDPQAMKAAQMAQDDELQQLVRSITSSLRAGKQAQEAARPSALAELLAKSCLTPFLVRELSTSYTSMGDRLPFFRELYELVQEILRTLPDHAGTVLGPARMHLLVTKGSAQTFLHSLGSSAWRDDLAIDVAFAHLAVQIADEVERLCEQTRLEAAAPFEVGGSSSSSAPAATAAESTSEAEYCKRLRPLQLTEGDLGASHAYSARAREEFAAPQARIVRLAKELAGLSSLLPLSGSSSVFVRVCSSHQQLWRALVTGPDDTPYSGGCFIFDVYFPVEYPSEPPAVKLLTTGNNTVTFNPNLYESGKVCLSLLGTWEGDKAERWNPTTSRMLQVLVSVQSLILVPEPYFNEPGFEREIGTVEGKSRSWKYNMSVRENSVRWAMLDILQSPPRELREVVREHFQLRGPRIKTMIAGWIAEAEEQSATEHKAVLASLLDSLERALASLEATEADDGGVQAEPAAGAAAAAIPEAAAGPLEEACAEAG